MDLILGLSTISPYYKRNKKMFISPINRILTVAGMPPSLIGLALEQDKEAAV